MQVPPTLVTYTPGEDEERQAVSSPILPFRTFTFGESLVAKVGGACAFCLLPVSFPAVLDGSRGACGWCLAPAWVAAGQCHVRLALGCTR